MASRTSHTPAHESAATVAPFRAWRGSQRIIARGPIRLAIELWFAPGTRRGGKTRIMREPAEHFNRNRRRMASVPAAQAFDQSLDEVDPDLGRLQLQGET